MGPDPLASGAQGVPLCNCRYLCIQPGMVRYFSRPIHSRFVQCKALSINGDIPCHRSTFFIFVSMSMSMYILVHPTYIDTYCRGPSSIAHCYYCTYEYWNSHAILQTLSSIFGHRLRGVSITIEYTSWIVGGWRSPLFRSCSFFGP